MNSAWKRSYRLVINNSYISGNLTNFPVLLSYNATPDGAKNLPSEMIMLGGQFAAKSDGSDIRFTLDAAGNVPLHAEIVNFSLGTTSTAKAEIWVNVPSLSSISLNNYIYVWYNNPLATMPAISDSSYGSNGVWTNYAAVWHMGNGSSISTTDSTGNGYTLTSTNWGGSPSPVAATGQVGGGAYFSTIEGGTTFQNQGSYMTIANSANLLASKTNVSVTMWVNSTDTNGNNGMTWTNPYLFGSNNHPFGIMSSAGNIALITTGSTNYIWTTSSISDGNWHYIAATYNTSPATSVLYYDSTNVGSITNSGAALISWPVNIGCDHREGTGVPFMAHLGTQDKIRVANSTLPQSWLQTEYNNQKYPSKFVTPMSNVATVVKKAAAVYKQGSILK